MAQVLLIMDLKTFAKIARVFVKVGLLCMSGYVVIILIRVMSATEGNYLDSVTLRPLFSTLSPKWIHLFSGNAWIDALFFVINTLELGTLIHGYLGSKLFYHYRTYR